MKDLETLHREISEAVSKLDFAAIWPDFSPLPFALFDDEKCFFDGKYVEKSDAFCANTSIVYEGKQIATWKAAEALETPIFASKLVHEMFHGFQHQQGWTCWPNEIEALFRYEYDAENLSCKLRENQLLLSLLDRFDADAFRELLSLRKLRRERFPYQFGYETQTEEIEGSANFVEWQVLRQLAPEKAEALTAQMRGVMTAPERLFPIRISCYYTGALMIHALQSAGVYDFSPAQRPALLTVLQDVPPAAEGFPGQEALTEAAARAIAAFHGETEAIIQTALKRNEILLEGPTELGYVNVYNARCRNGFLTSTFFLLYRTEAGETMLPGNFVIKMRDETTIETVYRWE